MRPNIEPLEDRRLMARVGLDVTWGSDGLAYAATGINYVGRAGRSFWTYTSGFSAGREVVGFRRVSDGGRVTGVFRAAGVDDYVQDAITDGQGRILVTEAGASELQVHRYGPDGRIDASFGTGGVVSLDAVAGDDDGSSRLATDGRGAVYVLRRSFDGTRERSTLTKLTPAGAVDRSFGRRGSVVLDRPGDGKVGVTPESDTPAFVGVDSKGRIVIVTNRRVGSTDNALRVTRLTPAGVVDRTYGRAGNFEAEITAGGTRTGGLALDTEDRLLVGERYYKSNRRVVGDRVRRITSDGRLDGRFGVNGDAAGYADETGGSNNLASVVARPDGTISALVGGRLYLLGDNGLPVRGRRPATVSDAGTLAGLTRDGRLLARAGGTLALLADRPPAVRGTSGRLYLTGDTGDDTFRLRRGSRDDQVYVDYNGRTVGIFDRVPSVVADLGDGDDTLLDRYLQSTRDVPFTVDAGAGDDRVETGAGADRITAGEGTDTVLAGGGGDTVYANALAVRTRSARNRLDGGAGRDTVYRESEDDVLSGFETARG